LGIENTSDVDKMKVFGFDNAESISQDLKTEGTINIAIGWDSSYVLSIEYNIPLKMLEGSITELNNKKISIGWKIKEADVTYVQTVTTRVVAVPSVGRTPSNRNSSSSVNNNPSLQSNPFKAQLIWSTYTIIL
jgi:hypothetical protein